VYHSSTVSGFELIGLRIVCSETAETYLPLKGKNAEEPFDLSMKLIKDEFEATVMVGNKKSQLNK
jgi:hypothetical protein